MHPCLQKPRPPKDKSHPGQAVVRCASNLPATPPPTELYSGYASSFFQPQNSHLPSQSDVRQGPSPKKCVPCIHPGSPLHLTSKDRDVPVAANPKGPRHDHADPHPPHPPARLVAGAGPHLRCRNHPGTRQRFRQRQTLAARAPPRARPPPRRALTLTSLSREQFWGGSLGSCPSFCQLTPASRQASFGQRRCCQNHWPGWARTCASRKAVICSTARRMSASG